MKKFFFQKILQKEGWLFNTKISIDKEGKIKEMMYLMQREILFKL